MSARDFMDADIDLDWPEISPTELASLAESIPHERECWYNATLYRCTIDQKIFAFVLHQTPRSCHVHPSEVVT